MQGNGPATRVRGGQEACFNATCESQGSVCDLSQRAPAGHLSTVWVATSQTGKRYRNAALLKRSCLPSRSLGLGKLNSPPFLVACQRTYAGRSLPTRCFFQIPLEKEGLVAYVTPPPGTMFQAKHLPTSELIGAKRTSTQRRHTTRSTWLCVHSCRRRASQLWGL